MVSGRNYAVTMYSVFMSSMLACLAQISCPSPGWYCLNRDPKDSGQVQAVDTSNRSVSWAWSTGAGRWDVAYRHSFTTGSYGVDACYCGYQDSRPACVSYSTASSWSCNTRLIPAPAWDISYNGDSFGFRPTHGGQYVFHIYSRNLHYNPWVANGGLGIPYANPPAPVIQETKGNCVETSIDRTTGSGWWLERRSRIKCSVLVNNRDIKSPMEWSWGSDAGTWKVVYFWSQVTVNCTVDFAPNGAAPSRLVDWTFQPELLLLTYSSNPVKIYRESTWKLMVSDGETWGYTPTVDGSWTFPVYSRNVLIRPFEKANGIFNLQLQ